MPKALEQYLLRKLAWMNIGPEEVTLLEVRKHSVVMLFERRDVTAKRIVFHIEG